jgi:hypothetical protein
MAQAKEMLDELKDQAPEADPFPTIRESLAELGANPDKYEKILAKTDEKLHWEKVFRPKTTLEAGAITLLAAAKQSGAEPEEYLSRLAPYFDSRIQSLPGLYTVAGYVSGGNPTRAIMTRTAREIKGSGYTLPHELEHTLQNVDFDNRGSENIDKVSVPGRPDPVLRFGGMDSLKGDLQKRLAELPEEERNVIAASHPVFGRYLSRGNELFARIRAKDMVDSAKGEDFLQTDLGQKLFPTDRDRSYFIGSTLPGVPKISPPYTFESTEQKKKPLTDPNTSYARQLYNKLTAPKEFAEGGEVTEFPEEQASPTQQDLSEAAKRLLYYKKTVANNPSPVIEATPQTTGQKTIGTLGGYMNQAGQFVSKSLDPIRESNPVKSFVADLLLADSLKNAGTALQDYTKTSREITEDQPYRRAPITGRGQTMSLDPRILDMIGIAQPAASAATKLVSAGAKKAAPFAKEMGEMASDLYMSGNIPGMVSPSSYVIKPKGGNWLQGYIDSFIVNPLSIEGGEQAPAINKWVDTKLRKYVQNEMGTPEDPLRDLAGRGISHLQPEELGYGVNNLLPESLLLERMRAGFSPSGIGATPMAKGWENIADTVIESTPAGDLASMSSYVKHNPWLAKLTPETPVYRMQGDSMDLGFNHLVDELNNASRADSDLPDRLQIDPSKLEKMTVPQVVERVSQINAWRAEQIGNADFARANNAATRVVKEYPDQGYKWVELAMPKITVDTPLPEGFKWLEPKNGLEQLEGPSIVDPQLKRRYLGRTKEEALVAAQERSTLGADQQKMLEDALKYEGDTMGHCVGGYCPDLLEGRSRIYSLRDSKGEPHVTIEVNPNEIKSWYDVDKAVGSLEGAKLRNEFEEIGGNNMSNVEAGFKMFIENKGIKIPPSIQQIKGKGNAKPKDTYLPFVQDFIKGEQWSEVRDFKNTGLIKEGGQMMTPAEHADWLAKQLDVPPQGMKSGGEVKTRDFIKSMPTVLPSRTKAKVDLSRMKKSATPTK